jgi:hypothetical protein
VHLALRPIRGFAPGGAAIGEQLDEAAWRRYHWHGFRFGDLVSDTHVLWTAWDTVVSHEGSLYQVEDLHCLDPACPCKDVCLVFSEPPS